MDEFRTDCMFCVVDFAGGRKRTVVPDSWLSINDTQCLLPRNASDSDVDALARNLAEPGQGWQILEVASIQTFGSYSEAKKHLNKSKETLQSEACRSRRKKKKPSYLEDYSTHDSDNGQKPYTVFGMDFDEEAMSENEWIPPPEFSSSIKDVSPIKKRTHNDPRPRIRQFNQSQLSSQKENIDIICDCQSLCHSTFLQALYSMQKQLNSTNQMVQQLLGGQKQTHSQLKRVLQSRPINKVNGQEEVDDFSQDSSNFVQCVLQNQNSSAAPKKTRIATSLTEAEDMYITEDLPSSTMSEMEFKKTLRNHIKFALREFQTENFDRVLTTLLTLGVNNKDSLKYVKSSDLLEVLNEVQARILVESFQNYPTLPPVSSLEASTKMSRTNNEAQIISPDHFENQILIEKVVSCNEASVNSPSTAVDLEREDDNSGSQKCPNFPLPELSIVLKPLLEGEVLPGGKDHSFLSSMLKEEIISFLDRENLICSGNSSTLRWEYRNLGETLAAKYPRMLFDFPSEKQKHIRKEDSPNYTVFIRRLSQRRKMKRLRLISKEKGSESPEEIPATS